MLSSAQLSKSKLSLKEELPAPLLAITEDPFRQCAPKKKAKEPETDWKMTAIHALVSNLLELAPNNRLANSKILFDNFMNPAQEDIFNEEEASYQASFLMKKAETESIIEESQLALLQQQYARA